MDHALGEFSSPLRFIADNWGLPYLTDRIRNSHNFEHVFDFGRPPRPPLVLSASPDCIGTGPYHFHRQENQWPPALRDMRGWWSR